MQERNSLLLSPDPSPVMSSGGYFLVLFSKLGCGLLVFFPRDQQELERLLQNRKEISFKDSLECY